MTAIRSSRGPFTNVRADVAQDRRLSLEARGIYAFLATLPPDEQPTPRWIAKQGRSGIDATKRALRELEAYGYIEPTGLAAPRVSIPLKLRYQTLRRDGYACRYCGARAPHAVLVVDHVVPVAQGGKTQLDNLVSACDPCNTGKSGAIPEQWLVDEVKCVTAEWLTTGGADEPDNPAMARPRGRGHVVVKICREP